MATTQIITEPAVPQMVTIRDFDAPKDLLLRAYTDPDLLEQWVGPREMTVMMDHVDPRDGGTWRYTSADAAGNEREFHGVFHGTPSPDGLVQTFESGGTPGRVWLETVTFTERGDTTVVTRNTVFQSADDRDAALRSELVDDVNESLERLDHLLSRLVLAS